MEVLLYTILTLCVLGVLAAIVLYFVAQKFRVEAVSYTHLTLPTNSA